MGIDERKVLSVMAERQILVSRIIRSIERIRAPDVVMEEFDT